MRFCFMLRTVLTESVRATAMPQVTLDQRDLGAVHRHVGSRSHGDAHVCLRQGRRVVDAVSGHGDDASFFLQSLDQHELVRRLDLTMHLVDA